MSKISRDVPVGFFDIVTSCAELVRSEPEAAKVVVVERVHAFTTGGVLYKGEFIEPDEVMAMLHRLTALATYAALRYAKLADRIAHDSGQETVDVIRADGEAAILETLDIDDEPSTG